MLFVIMLVVQAPLGAGLNVLGIEHSNAFDGEPVPYFRTEEECNKQLLEGASNSQNPWFVEEMEIGVRASLQIDGYGPLTKMCVRLKQGLEGSA